MKGQKCAHCGKPITWTQMSYGWRWLHADGDTTGLCFPMSLEENTTTLAEPK